MWKLKIGEGVDGPYLYSTNNYVGRQTWEFDPDAGTPEERAQVEEVRQNFYRNHRQVKPCGDFPWRMQTTTRLGFKLTIAYWGMGSSLTRFRFPASMDNPNLAQQPPGGTWFMDELTTAISFFSTSWVLCELSLNLNELRQNRGVLKQAHVSNDFYLLESITPESSTSSSTVKGSSNHHSSSSYKSLSSEATPSDDEGSRVGNGIPTMTNMEESEPIMGVWENKPLVGKLDNIRKASQDFSIEISFTVVLHHDVVDNAAINKVARWKRLFIFVRDARMKRVNNELVAHMSEWRTAQTYMNYPTLVPSDVDLKNALLDYVEDEGLVDFKALVTLKQLAAFGFVDIANLYVEGEMNSMLERQHEQAQRSRGWRAKSSLHMHNCFLPRIHVDAKEKRWMLMTTCCLLCDVERALGSIQPLYVCLRSLQLRQLVELKLGMHSFVPLVYRQKVKSYVQENGGRVAMLKLMDATWGQTRELAEKCKRMFVEKASLEDEVNNLQSSVMANRVAAIESQANGLNN
ncbi:hypothetical protein SLEP1_g36029 [Rubroshorea leprosula]|uniref:Beta-amyrin synthase n=1 Tax=Rubroshorea leprosula TaxID=152421 RepID=A0AAV5KQB0_9ROSI|nr:hypothetical protein SLEP1_g36029 [Rubroshorea leprosula]